MHILAIDVAISTVEAAVVETVSPASPIAVARVNFQLEHPTPGASEIIPEKLWQAITQAARRATQHSDAARNRIEGIGLACVTPELVLLDKDGRPAAPIWTHLDRRSRPAARQVWNAVGEEFLNCIGNRPLPGSITAISYRQQINDNPYLIHRVKSYLHLNGWLGFRLTGEKAFEPANASVTGLYGTLTDRQWSPRWREYFEVEREWLPAIISGNQLLGTLRSAAANELGVPPGIPVKLGICRTSSAILAAGMNEQDLLHESGDTQKLTKIVDKPIPVIDLCTRQLAVGSGFMQSAYNPVGGEALEWTRRLCFQDQSEAVFYQQTLREAAQRNTSVAFHPPCLAGAPLEIEAVRAALQNLTLSTRRMDIAAAVVQAMVEHHRQALNSLGRSDKVPLLSNPRHAGTTVELSAKALERVFFTGCRANVIRQILPDYVGSLTLSIEKPSLRGIARLFESEKEL